MDIDKERFGSSSSSINLAIEDGAWSLPDTQPKLPAFAGRIGMP
jgi:hypothetical protein